MPDLTTEYYYHCLSAEGFVTFIKGSTGKSYAVHFQRMPRNHPYQYDWECECQGFQYYGKCKHIEQAKTQRCGWYQFTDGGEPVNGKCPKCQGDIRSQGHGV